MADSAVSTQVQALLKPAEPALAYAYFAQVRYWIVSGLSIPQGRCLVRSP